MILKALKEKSNRKYLNTLLRRSKQDAKKGKIETVAFLFFADEFEDIEFFGSLLKDLNLKSPRHKIIGFTNNKSYASSTWDTVFNSRDFGWNGKIKHKELVYFLDENYDMLISFYKSESLELDLITAGSKAKFKVGIRDVEERLYDLIINVNPKETNVFSNELIKYLTILNKL